MAKTREPHPSGMLAWACGVDSYAADVAVLYPPVSSALLDGELPEVAEPEIHAALRDAERRDQDDQAFREFVLKAEASASGAPDEWLESEGGRAFFREEARRVRAVKSAAFWASAQLEHRPRRPKSEGFARPVVADVVAGAYFATRGDMAEAARRLNAGIPTRARVEGVTPSEVRNALNTFKQKRFRGDVLLADRYPAYVILATEAAMQFYVKVEMLRKLKQQAEFRSLQPFEIFWRLVETGRLLDLHNEVLKSAPALHLEVQARFALAAIAKAELRALDRIRVHRGLAA